MWKRLHVKYPLFWSDFNGTWIFLTDSWKEPKCQISSKFIQWESSCFIWTDGWTDMAKLIVTFCSFECANKFKIDTSTCYNRCLWNHWNCSNLLSHVILFITDMMVYMVGVHHMGLKILQPRLLEQETVVDIWNVSCQVWSMPYVDRSSRNSFGFKHHIV